MAHRRPRALAADVACFLIAIYGGYFGAAAGVLLLALLLRTTGETLPGRTRPRTCSSGFANTTAR